MFFTTLCNYCCDLMQGWADLLGVSYGFVNILFFVILQPLLFFVALGLVYYSTYNDTPKFRRRLRKISVYGIVAYIAGSALVVLVPLVYLLLR